MERESVGSPEQGSVFLTLPFVTFWLGVLFYIVCPAVLTCRNLKLHQMLEVKNTFKQEKVIL